MRPELNDLLRSMKILTESVKYTLPGGDEMINTYAHVASIAFIGTDTYGMTYRDRLTEKFFSRPWKDVGHHPGKFQIGYPLLYSYEYSKEMEPGGAVVELEIGVVDTYEDYDRVDLNIFDPNENGEKLFNQILDDTERMLIGVVGMLKDSRGYDVSYVGGESERLWLPRYIIETPGLLSGVTGKAVNSLTELSGGKGIKVDPQTIFKIENESAAGLWGTGMSVRIGIKLCPSELMGIAVEPIVTRPDGNQNS